MIKSYRSSKAKVITASRLVIIGVVLVVISTLAVFANHNSVKDKTKPAASGTATQQTKGEPAQTTSTSDQPGDTKNQTSYGGQADTSAALLAPTGTFVSNHRPNLSGSPAPNEIQSVCNTTPGANCQISFTKDGVTKSLSSEVTDRGGAVYWTWKLQDVGLNEGSWSIQAKATLGSRVQTSDDAMNLEVAP